MRPRRECAQVQPIGLHVSRGLSVECRFRAGHASVNLAVRAGVHQDERLHALRLDRASQYGHGAVGDVQRLTDIPDASFDLIASFETIEHVPDDRAYVDETARVLRPGGMLLVSTPDRRLGSIGPRLRKVPSNPFHIREYSRRELIDLLSRRFEIVEEFGQNFANPVLCLLPIQATIKAAAYALRNFGGQRVSNALYYGGTGPIVRSARNRWGIAGYWVMLCRRPATL